jgi:ribosomal protein L29
MVKENNKRINDLKIELLRNPTKRKNIKKEIARLLTMETKNKLDGENK